MKTRDTFSIAYTALMAALVFAATYLIKIPNPATGGYSHMGDCMIFLAVVILGRRNGAIAASIGGAVIIKDPMNTKKQFVGALIGGLFQMISYTIVKVVLIGVGPAVMSIPNVTIQTGTGIVLFMVLIKVLSNHAAGIFSMRGDTK